MLNTGLKKVNSLPPISGIQSGQVELMMGK